MKNYKNIKTVDIQQKKSNKLIWTERINSRDRNKDLKVKNIQGAVLLELLSYVKFKVN